MWFSSSGMGWFASGTVSNLSPQQQTDLSQLLLFLLQDSNDDDDITLSVITEFTSFGSDTLTLTETGFTVIPHSGAYHYGDADAKWGEAQWG